MQHLQYNIIYCDKTGKSMKLFNLEMDTTEIKSGVFLTKFGYKLLLSLSAQPDCV